MNHICLYSVSIHQNGATPTEVVGRHLIAAYYSFIDPERMTGWVGLSPFEPCHLPLAGDPWLRTTVEHTPKGRAANLVITNSKCLDRAMTFSTEIITKSSSHSVLVVVRSASLHAAQSTWQCAHSQVAKSLVRLTRWGSRQISSTAFNRFYTVGSVLAYAELRCTVYFPLYPPYTNLTGRHESGLRTLYDTHRRAWWEYL